MDTLARAGIDEAFIQRKGRSASFNDDEISDEDPTYSRMSSARSGSYSRPSTARSKASNSRTRSKSYNSVTDKKYSDSEGDRTAEEVSDFDD